LVMEGNQLLYGKRPWSPKAVAVFVLQTFPRAVRSQWRGIMATHLLFYGLCFFIGLLVVRVPNAVYDFIPESEVASFEDMYDPGSNTYLRPSDVSSAADMFGYYIYNNVAIAFRTFAGGLLAGVGSLFFLCYNAVDLGAVGGHLVNAKLGRTFFPFVIAHGAFELTAIVFSAYAGLQLGYSLFVTRGRTRRASLQAAANSALPIVAGSALFLVVAAAIEAFWSSRHNLPDLVRYGVGGGLWLAVILYFAFSGRESSA
jgi:uncharacterized membrane protein SpoIIM required for sporulation